MSTPWLSEEQLAAWIRLLAITELLPGVLDSQLRREADLTHFEYYVLAMLSEAPGRGRRMSSLAALTNALKVVGKMLPDVRVVMSGAGAAGTAVLKLLLAAGAGTGRGDVVVADVDGVVHRARPGRGPAGSGWRG